MGIKRYKPITPGLRQKTSLTFDELTETAPEKSLISGKRKTNGRMRTGQISIRRRGGGHKRKYRVIDSHTRAHNGLEQELSKLPS